ncbi:uncharacterized membrane protein YhaH (DUF805 family) [Undibacterium sp. GrIS 1.8]|uniref:DUF805 domain-containing protein n=1 Tax=Undibacterium sp. GrIS 1.8 TaxID=3143934 RepID=UPI003391259F
MSMVFCRGCGKEIHETAPTCPHCGASQTVSSTSSALPVESEDISQAFDWYVLVLKKYIQFNGRSRRKEFWFFTLFTILISIGLSIVDRVTGTSHFGADSGLLSSLYSLATLIPGLAVSVRRLHDTDRSAWWLLIGLVPVVGVIVLIVFWATDSQRSENQFGACPKEM